MQKQKQISLLEKEKEKKEEARSLIAMGEHTKASSQDKKLAYAGTSRGQTDRVSRDGRKGLHRVARSEGL